jgi:hypothetical protein
VTTGELERGAGIGFRLGEVASAQRQQRTPRERGQVGIDRAAGARVGADVGDQVLGALRLVGEHQHRCGVADDRRASGTRGDEASAVETAIDQLAPAVGVRARLGSPTALEDQQRVAGGTRRQGQLVQGRQPGSDLGHEATVDRRDPDPNRLEHGSPRRRGLPGQRIIASATTE